MILDDVLTLSRDFYIDESHTIVVTDYFIQVQHWLNFIALAVIESGFEDVVIFKLDVGGRGVETHPEDAEIEKEISHKVKIALDDWMLWEFLDEDEGWLYL